MEMDKLQRGAMLGIIAGFLFIAFAGSGVQTPETEAMGEDMEMTVPSMSAPGMQMMIAGMVGSDSALVGFILHIIFSAIIGAIYVGWGESFASGGWQTLGVGLVYGVIWWIVGANLIMPIIAGGDALQLDFNGTSLLGHIIFGVTLAWIAEATGGAKETM